MCQHKLFWICNFQSAAERKACFCWLMEKRQTFPATCWMGNWGKQNKNAYRKLPSSSPNISFGYLPVIVSSIYLASCFFKVTDSGFNSFWSPPAKVLVFSLNALVLLLSALSFSVVHNRNTHLIRTLFPNFHGRRSRGRDLWQALELNPIIIWYVTGETPETLKSLLQKYTER